MAVRGPGAKSIGVAVAIVAFFLPASAGAFQFVYAGGFDSGMLGYGARVNGGLSESSHSPFDTEADSLEGLAMSPDGKNLFAADFDSNTLLSFRADRRGGLSASGSPQPTGFNNYGVAPTPNGKFVYASAELPAAVSGFKVAKSGALSPVSQDPVPVPAPTGLAVSPNGKFLFVATETAPGNVYSFAIGAGGSLTAVPGSPAAGATSAFAIAIAPNGKTVYAANRGSQGVNAFHVAANGSLTPLVGTPYPTGGSNPFGLTVSPNGENVYVALYNTGQVAAFDVGGGGALTPQAGSPYSGPTSASALSLDPLGNYLYEQSSGSAIRVVPLDNNGVPGSPTAFTFTSHGDFQSIVTAPDQAPTARFKAPKHAVAHSQESFNASESRSRNGIEHYIWKFGDGEKDDTSKDKVKHSFSKPGKYKVKLTLITQDGCSTKYVSAGQTPYCNGSKKATTTETVKVSK